MRKVELRVQCTFLILIVGFLFASRAAQGQNRESRAPWDIWLDRAEEVTSEVANQLNLFERGDLVRLQARVGLLWWAADKDKSRLWLEKAIRSLEGWHPENGKDSKKAISDRFQTTRWLLVELGGLGPDYAKRLSEKFMSFLPSEEAISAGERRDAAAALAVAGTRVVKNDPEAAYRLGKTALNYSGASEVVQLISLLGLQNSQLADKLFSEALSLARTKRDISLLVSLAYSIHGSPENLSAYRPSPHLAAQVLDAIRDGSETTLPSERDYNARCQFVSAASWFVDQLPSNDKNYVEAAKSACLDDPQTRMTATALAISSNSQLQSAGEFMQASNSSRDLQQKTFYLYAAASKALAADDFSAAIKALDQISKEQRDERWNTVRVSVSSRMSIFLFKKGDLPGMRLAISDVPEELRPYVLTAAANSLSGTGDPTTALQLANDARRYLEQSDKPDTAAYIQLTSVFATLAPEQLPALIKRAIQLLNEAAEQKARFSPFDGRIKGNDFVPYALSSAFLEAEPGIVQSTRRIKDPYARIGFLLGLLRTSLDRASNRPCCAAPKG